MKHFLSLEALDGGSLAEIIKMGAEMKNPRKLNGHQLQDQSWAMIFTKSSTRTRVSFEVAVRELGGRIFFLSPGDSQLGRGEPVRDTARVLGRMAHGAIIRTYDQADIEEFAEYAKIPTVNALSDQEHPCQILGDLLTIQEKRGAYEGQIFAFLGDGDCNVARSLIFAADVLDFQLRIIAPESHQPSQELLAKLKSNRVEVSSNIEQGMLGVDVIYTDTWVSMGKEAEAAERLQQLAPYQINAALVQKAAPDAIVMHCLPAYREKEITEEVFEKHAEVIFTQAENRLHIQKAILAWLVR